MQRWFLPDTYADWKRNLRIKFQDLESLESALCVLVLHADDTDMVTDRTHAENDWYTW